MKKLILILGSLLLLFGCTTNEPINVEPANIELDAAGKVRVKQDNNFAFTLLNQVIQNVDSPNVFLSPMSLSMALGMLRNGAIDNTLTEIDNALLLSGISNDEINAYYYTMKTGLPNVDPSHVSLNIANSIWYDKNLTVRDDFLTTNSTYFDAYVKALDFTQFWAVDTINGWCNRETNGLIPKVLQNIDGDAVMFLMNAVYFKGSWTKEFNTESTTEDYFYDESDESSLVDMMVKEDTVGYEKNNMAAYIDLPYGDGAFSMTVILPNDGETTIDVIQNLTNSDFETILGSMKSTKVKIELPRFKTENEYFLNSTLQSMGMQRAFTKSAQFDEIADLKPLYVDFVKQNTYIEVTERGTKAAAVTTIGMITSSAPEVDTTPLFMVNRPFIFVIREKTTGVILFIGKIGHVDKF